MYSKILLPLLLLGLSFLCPRTHADSVPKLINYQGKLTDSTGDTLANGEYSVRFELFDAPQDGTLIWGETRTVTLVVGVFNVALGGAGAQPVADTAVNDLGFAFSSAERYLQTTVVSGPGVTEEQTLLPRQQMTSVPFAVRSETAAHSDDSNLLNGQSSSYWTPTGVIVPFAGSQAPPGWLLCNGQALSRSDYADLFEVIGGSYGSGDGTSTFNIPNGQGLVLRGVGSHDFGGRVKLGPALGGRQEDQFQGHRTGQRYGGTSATFPMTGASGGGSTQYGLTISGAGAYYTGENILTTGAFYPDSSNGSPRTGAETRVAALGVNFIIKY